MIKNYSFKDINIVSSDIKKYEKDLDIYNNIFCRSKLLSFDSSSVELEYDLTSLYSYNDLKNTTEVFKVQAIRSIVKLISDIQSHYKVDLSPENLYFDGNASAKFLLRGYDGVRKTPEDYLLDLKTLIGGLFLNEKIAEIHTSGGGLIAKNKVIGKLAEVSTLDEFVSISDEIIKNEMQKLNKELVLVDKDFVSKVKKSSKIYLILILIAISLILFLITIYIPNRNTQLDAIVSYENNVYEDVLEDLNETNLDAMSPVIKYIMAESTIRLSDLSDTQKENILFNLSPTVTEGILDFWVYIGQHDLDSAYNKAIENNDAQQKAYVLLLLIDNVQNDSSLDVEEKEGLLSTYQGELDSIVTSMEDEEE